MAYQILFTDLDGTLLTGRSYGKGLTPACKLAAEKAMAAGKHIIINSGRSYKSIASFEKQLGIDVNGGCGSSLNGGVVYEYVAPASGNAPAPINVSAPANENVPALSTSGRRILSKHGLPRELALRVVAEIKKYRGGIGDILVYNGESDLYTEHRTPSSEEYSRVIGLPVHYVEDISEIDGDILKIIAEDNFGNLQGLYREMVDAFKDEIYTVFSCPVLLEFGSPLSNKGNGVKLLANHLHIPLSDVIAMGDESNDIPMLKAAGLGIAVANATDETKAAADIVLPYSNNEDAFARVIEEYML